MTDRKGPAMTGGGTGGPDRDDDVGRLIRLAGRRHTVAQERTARVRAVVQKEWLDGVRRRKRQRIIWGAAALAVAASVLLIVSLGGRANRNPSPSPDGILVVAVSEPAWAPVGTEREPGFEAPPLRAQVRLPFGSTVETGEGGGAALRLSAADSIRLDAASRLRVLDAGTLVLERGAVYVDSGGDSAEARSLTIRTPLGSVREIGTQYEVRLLEATVRIRVREGMVTLDDGSRVHEVDVARELVLDADGSMTTQEIPIHGPEWDWVGRIATLPNLDGASARTFLDHVARERGWRIKFADERTERAAARIRIGGSIDRLSLDHALDTVLPTCGMTYRIEDGTLIVSQAGGGT